MFIVNDYSQGNFKITVVSKLFSNIEDANYYIEKVSTDGDLLVVEVDDYDWNSKNIYRVDGFRVCQNDDVLKLEAEEYLKDFSYSNHFIINDFDYELDIVKRGLIAEKGYYDAFFDNYNIYVKSSDKQMALEWGMFLIQKAVKEKSYLEE
jgi:hypothetical protein